MDSPVLVINCGSSSVKTALVDEGGRHLADVRIEDLGGTPRLNIGTEVRAAAVGDVAGAVLLALDELASRALLGPSLVAVGHRVAHGGEQFTGATLVDASVEEAIAALGRLAPLHNPAAVIGLRALRARLPQLPHVAVFDTAFHATLPRSAREYALPTAVSARLGLRRYGFHGISHAYVARAAALWLRTEATALRLITCHLGAGASVAAVDRGRSVETSMGLTPLEGLVMATRPGDLDPGVVVELLRSGLSLAELERLLNHEAGLVGLTGTADMREVERRARSGDDASRLALEIYTHRVRKYIGAYAAVMGGVDGIVFTGGVGEHSAGVRGLIAERLEFLGAEIDHERNRDAAVGPGDRVAEISVAGNRCPLLVVATDEEAAVAAATRRLLAGDR